MRSSLIALTATLAAGAAQAADLPPMTAPTPVVAPMVDWTGFYAGGFVGAARTDGEAELTDVQGPLLTLDVNNGLFPREIDDEDIGFYGGAMVGYDYQVGQGVFGARATLGYLDLEADPSLSLIDPGPIFPGVTTNSSYETEFDYLATLEATAGVAFGRLKVFAAGGLAFADVENSVTIGVPNTVPGVATFPYGPTTFENSDTLFGYTVGGGIAYQATEALVVSLDVMHFDLSDQSVRAIDPPAFGQQYLDYEFENDGQFARLGVAYRF